MPALITFIHAGDIKSTSDDGLSVRVRMIQEREREWFVVYTYGGGGREGENIMNEN